MSKKNLSLYQRAGAAALALAAGAATAASDLPGGPAVLQMNLGTPATRIAGEQIWLHWFLLIVCTIIFVGVFAPVQIDVII